MELCQTIKTTVNNRGLENTETNFLDAADKQQSLPGKMTDVHNEIVTAVSNSKGNSPSMKDISLVYVRRKCDQTELGKGRVFNSKRIQAYSRQPRGQEQDYLQKLQSLSSVELSRHVVELEKRSFQLSLEEAKELQRAAYLNVWEKSGIDVESSLNAHKARRYQIWVYDLATGRCILKGYVIVRLLFASSKFSQGFCHSRLRIHTKDSDFQQLS
ncbi:hypothetical protein ACFE04_015364 [Oxalis oulophora]